MAATEVKVTGLKELQKFMSELPDKLQANVMRGALRAGAKVLEAEAKRAVPVDQGVLRNSIRVSTRSKRGVVSASVKATDFKAHWIEYGTGAHWISVNPDAKPKASLKTLNKALAKGSLRIGEHFVGAAVHHPGAAAQPYMRPALDARGMDAVLATANYIKTRLASKHALDTSEVIVEAEEE